MEIEAKEQTIKIRNSLMRLLARREHSRLELIKKMLIRGFDDTLIKPIIDDFIEHGWQSDSRYAEMLIRSRVLKCHGPIKIKMELKQNGVSEDIIEQCMSEQNGWVEIATMALIKKFTAAATDQSKRNKQYRFLTQRGFNNEQIKLAIKIHK